ncbi:MAG: sigma-70 family RNA polymerase sigma factor [Sandaracinaceae bacterium]|nr:sigma-70 family RNA polymerase sigma factor [Sandaracinaceae bacterium]
MAVLDEPTLYCRYRASLSNLRILSPEEERELARRWLEGDQRAGEALIESSLPFVIRIAHEYRRWGVPLDDLIQQGNLGLLKAAAKFDPDKNCRLVTYAAYWIRAEIRDYVVRSYRIVRLGTTRTERRAMRAFRRESIARAELLAEKSGMPLARASMLFPLLMQGDVSLDLTVDDRESLLERISAGGADPELSVSRADERMAIRKALGQALECLSERERRIVDARMLADEPTTLEELGVEFGVSKERVRQLEARAKEKLRRELADFQPAA